MKISKIFSKIENTFNAEFNNCENINKEQLVNYCNKYWFKDVTENTCRCYLQYINMYLSQKNIDCKLNVTDFKVRSTKEGLVTKEELMSYIDVLDNEQDKFILYALFNDVSGTQIEDLRNLKVEQVDLENKKIILSDKEIKMDDVMVQLVEGAIKQDSYELIKFSENASVATYNFNMNCDYIIKNRPTKTNGMGLDAMKYDAFRKRLKTISQYLDNNVTPDLLIKSGYAYEVYKQYGADATYSQIEKMVKEKGMKAGIRTVVSAYRELYK